MAGNLKGTAKMMCSDWPGAAWEGKYELRDHEGKRVGTYKLKDTDRVPGRALRKQGYKLVKGCDSQ
jgi:hypothetical protein